MYYGKAKAVSFQPVMTTLERNSSAIMIYCVNGRMGGHACNEQGLIVTITFYPLKGKNIVNQRCRSNFVCKKIVLQRAEENAMRNRCFPLVYSRTSRVVSVGSPQGYREKEIGHFFNYRYDILIHVSVL